MSGSVVTPSRPSLFGRLFNSPILWGGLLTWGFYAALPVLPTGREFLTGYFCGHPLSYITATLFFMGMAIVANRALDLLLERSVWSRAFLAEVPRLGGGSATETAEKLSNLATRFPLRLRETVFVRRLRDLADHVTARRSSDNLEGHLKYLADLAADRLHASFSLVRTITWAVPILGFLGTVIGITLAIANVTPDQLETSLGSVTSGLSVAFDTTALALGLSLVLVFASFLVERGLSGELDRVEEFGLKHLSPLFPADTTPASPLMAAEAEAARMLVLQTEQLVTRQTQQWESLMEGLRERWTETIARQERELSDALTDGVRGSLADHADALARSRDETRQTLAALWADVRTDVVSWREDDHQRFAAVIEATTAQIEELKTQGGLLKELTGDQRQLVQLETQLTRNLESLRAAESLEETLHSLTAAVHLLTNRTRPRAA